MLKKPRCTELVRLPLFLYTHAVFFLLFYFSFVYPDPREANLSGEGMSFVFFFFNSEKIAMQKEWEGCWGFGGELFRCYKIQCFFFK